MIVQGTLFVSCVSAALGATASPDVPRAAIDCGELALPVMRLGRSRLSDHLWGRSIRSRRRAAEQLAIILNGVGPIGSPIEQPRLVVSTG